MNLKLNFLQKCKPSWYSRSHTCIEPRINISEPSSLVVIHEIVVRQSFIFQLETWIFMCFLGFLLHVMITFNIWDQEELYDTRCLDSRCLLWSFPNWSPQSPHHSPGHHYPHLLRSWWSHLLLSLVAKIGLTTLLYVLSS